MRLNEGEISFNCSAPELTFVGEPVELTDVTMRRDILRDGILLIFLSVFLYQIYYASEKVLAKEKAMKTRY